MDRATRACVVIVGVVAGTFLLSLSQPVDRQRTPANATGLARVGEFEFELVDGTHVSSQSLKGRDFVLVFSGPKCVPCEPALAQLVGDVDGTLFLIIAVPQGEDWSAVVAEWTDERQIHVPVAVLARDRVQADFGVREYPTVVFEGPEPGRVRSVVGGTTTAAELARWKRLRRAGG